MGTTYILPRAAALSEFVSGYHGDCGQTAALAALHVIRGTDLTAANLRALVQRDIAAGRAGPSGAEPITSIAATLKEHDVKYTLYPFKGGAGYGEAAHKVLLDTFHGADPGPVILEVANGQALPGDERHLHYHFITVLGIGPEGYHCADGDNPAAKIGDLVIYTWAQLAAAVPCALIRCQLPAATPQSKPDPLAEQVTRLKAQLVAAEAKAAKLEALVVALKAVLI